MILWVYPRPTNSGVREGFLKGGPADKNEQTIISLLVLVGGIPPNETVDDSEIRQTHQLIW